jgi:ABC-type transport system involved in Fe-S cluster assembly fused permease/ATPase subunit
LAVFEMPELLTAAGSFIALLGSLIGIAISVYFMDIYGFTPVIATFFIVNFFAFFCIRFFRFRIDFSVQEKAKAYNQKLEILNGDNNFGFLSMSYC